MGNKDGGKKLKNPDICVLSKETAEFVNPLWCGKDMKNGWLMNIMKRYTIKIC